MSPGQEGLDWIADLIRGRRARTQIKIYKKTAKALKEAGLSPKVVPHKTLVPLLAFAALEEEDDDEMATRWANLLANAASESDAEVFPSFPDLLRQLTPIEAAALDRIVDDQGQAKGEWLWSIQKNARLRDEHLDDLERHGLVRFEAPTGEVRSDRSVPMGDRHMIKPSALGLAFVRACRAPQHGNGS